MNDIANAHIELPFFTNLLILLVSAKILGEVFERFKQPAMIGEIIAGILVGPSLLNVVHRTGEIKTISELGIFLLVIIAGLEIDIDDILKSLRGRNIIISLFAFFFPVASGLFVGYFFGLEVMTTVFVGLCIAITALPVSIRILMDLGKIKTEIGQKIISVAILDDVLALTVLGVLLNIKDTDKSPQAIFYAGALSVVKLLVFIAMLSAVYLLMKRLLRRGNYIENALNKAVSFLKSKQSLFAIFFAFVLLFATFTETLGLHFIVGAFFASMLLNQSLLGKENLKAVESTVSSMAMGFLAPVFFAGIGLEFNVYSIHNVWLLIAILVTSYGSKIIGGFFGGRLAGLGKQTSLMLGIGLNARGIMELVIANVAYQNKLISSEIFSILVIMGVLTTLTTPLMLKKAFSRAGH